MITDKIFTLCDMQNALDTRILKEKAVDLAPHERLNNTIVALIVELAEFANEGRWFKFWSKDQLPRTESITDCEYCIGTGDMNAEANVEMLMEGQGGYPYKKCDSCNGTGKNKPTNPLLEEFSDGVHFFLSIANQTGFREELLIDVSDYRKHGTLESRNAEFLIIVSALSSLKIQRLSDTEKRLNFKMAWESYLLLGMIEFGFTFEDIYNAYLKKNAKNHDRQDSGY